MDDPLASVTKNKSSALTGTPPASWLKVSPFRVWILAALSWFHAYCSRYSVVTRFANHCAAGAALSPGAGLLRIRTLVAKLGGVSFTIASGMVAGKEGPFVHGGGLLAAGLSQMASPSLGLDFKFPNQFRNDLDKRDFVAIGTAAGVACAFGAPIGGILFAVEEGASFYSTGITWRGFLATSVGVFTVQALFQASPPPPQQRRLCTIDEDAKPWC